VLRPRRLHDRRGDQHGRRRFPRRLTPPSAAPIQPWARRKSFDAISPMRDMTSLLP
jgi:hypothetical protein